MSIGVGKTVLTKQPCVSHALALIKEQNQIRRWDEDGTGKLYVCWNSFRGKATLNGQQWMTHPTFTNFSDQSGNPRDLQ